MADNGLVSFVKRTEATREEFERISRRIYLGERENPMYCSARYRTIPHCDVLERTPDIVVGFGTFTEFLHHFTFYFSGGRNLVTAGLLVETVGLDPEELDILESLVRATRVLKKYGVLGIELDHAKIDFVR